MKFLGLNSPEIFFISVIILSILGPKRIEKGWFLFQQILMFLLSKEQAIEVKQKKPEVIEVKEKSIEPKSEEPEVVEIKEEATKAKSKKPEVIEVKEKTIEADLNEIKQKAKILKKDMVKKDK